MKKSLLYIITVFLFLSLCLSVSAGISQLMLRARNHMNIFQFREAINLLEKVIEVEPDNHQAHYMLGRSYFRLEQLEDSRRHLKKSVELNPDNLEAAKALGAIYVTYATKARDEGNTHAMVDFIHKSCRAYPQSPRMWLNLFNAWWDAGEYHKILSEADFMVRANRSALREASDENLQNSLLIVAKTFFRSGNVVNADRYLTKASRIRAQNSELAQLRRQIDDHLKQQLDSFLKQARTEIERGAYDRAIEILEKASAGSASSQDVEDLKREARTLQSVSRITSRSDRLVARQNYEEALDLLSQAVADFPEEDRIISRLSAVEQKVSEINERLAQKHAQNLAQRRERAERERRLEFLINEAKEHEKEMNYELAILSYRTALELDDSQTDLHNEIKRMQNLHNKELKKQAEWENSFNNLQSLFNNENYDEALRQGQQLIQQYDEHIVDISVIAAKAALEINEYDQAISIAYNFYLEEEHSDLYNYIVGMSAYMQRDRARAQEHFNQISRNSSYRNEIGSALTRIYIYNYRYGIYILMLIFSFPVGRAIKDFLRQHKIRSLEKKIEQIKETGHYAKHLSFLAERHNKQDYSNQKIIKVMYAEALLATSDYQNAYQLATDVLKKDGRNIQAKRIAGEASLKLENKSPTALELVQNLYKIDESRKDVVDYLAEAYMDMQADHKLAQDFILKHISIHPTSERAVLFMADIYLKREIYNEQSAKIFEKATSMKPEEKSYYQALLYIYSQTNRQNDYDRISELAHKNLSEPIFEAEQNTQETNVYDQQHSQHTSETSHTSPLPNSDQLYPDQPENDQQQENISRPSRSFGMPDYDNIGEENDNETTINDNETTNQSNSDKPTKGIPEGPTQTCPHCSATNSIKDYYCLSCGKPLQG